jgi:hypothetical protein
LKGENMAKFYVTKEEICPRCRGEKYIQHQIWVDYWAWVTEFKEQHNGRLPNPDEEPIWANELPASEEILCPDCDGLGVKTEKVELADALRELGFTPHAKHGA